LLVEPIIKKEKEKEKEGEKRKRRGKEGGKRKGKKEGEKEGLRRSPVRLLVAAIFALFLPLDADSNRSKAIFALLFTAQRRL
jgi:flagellar biosynthesis/type III secretory pathway protein FliH